jgi:hypothetical protein
VKENSYHGSLSVGPISRLTVRLLVPFITRSQLGVAFRKIISAIGTASIGDLVVVDGFVSNVLDCLS